MESGKSVGKLVTLWSASSPYTLQLSSRVHPSPRLQEFKSENHIQCHRSCQKCPTIVAFFKVRDASLVLTCVGAVKVTPLFSRARHARLMRQLCFELGFRFGLFILFALDKVESSEKKKRQLGLKGDLPLRRHHPRTSSLRLGKSHTDYR